MTITIIVMLVIDILLWKDVFPDIGLETFTNREGLANPSKNAADIINNQHKINTFSSSIKSKITNLESQLNKLDKEIEANTAKIKADQDKRNQAYNKMKNQQSQLAKKMAAAKQGKLPPPWVGTVPPAWMMPVPIQ